MDETLIARARAVKRRRHARLPTLWLFTDPLRLADPLAAIARLPAGPGAPFCAGVVYRPAPDAGLAAERLRLGRRIAALCRARGIALVVAGDWRLAARIGAGVHLRAGDLRRPGRITKGPVTAAAHDAAELRRACGGRPVSHGKKPDLVFLSPVFPTASHPGAPALGPSRWARLARGAPCAVAALGGVTGNTAKNLPRFCAGYGAIGAIIACYRR
jgi:thiamine-phosphate pyrophosphorylase